MSEVRLPAPVKATPVYDIEAADVPAGAFELSGEPPGGLWYMCPCGCGTQGFLAIRPANPAHPSWGWDGNRDAPTLTPSVHHVGHWHGFLRAGVWEQA